MSKKIIIKVLCILLSIVPAIFFNPTITKTATATVPDVQPYANQTGYKYRLINGKLHKRLWSYTYHRWEESYWTLA